MTDLHITETRKSPLVHLKDGNLQFSGRTIPEDPAAFFEPVIGWVKEYARDMAEHTTVDLKFEYINTASTKWIYNILKTLGEVEDHQKKMVVNWHYEVGDDDMYELGHVLRKVVESPFNFIEVEESDM
jgi:hypothetical protein